MRLFGADVKMLSKVLENIYNFMTQPILRGEIQAWVYFVTFVLAMLLPFLVIARSAYKNRRGRRKNR